MRIAALLLFALVLFSCRKESFTTNPDALLAVSDDTLHFDTVFTATGSVTQMVKIYNGNSKGVRLGSIELKGGAASPFRLNVNGLPGTRFTDLAIAHEDSIYLFVSVKIDPSAAALPFVVRDSIELQYNGHTDWVQLEAFGRNAHFFRARRITGNETWTADLPYVILGGLEVAADATLTIREGCRVYLHADAPLLVNGTLKVQGSDSLRVVFTGDRLDDPYRDFPASWPGLIFLDGSKDNSLQFAEIRNAYQAIVVQNPSVNGAPKLQLQETIIDNAYDAGILASNAHITARNLLVSNCGRNLLLVNGGNYSFVHCTVASYANSYLAHDNPVLIVADYLDQAGPFRPVQALFRNCIFWAEGGLVKSEAVALRRGNQPFNVQFDQVLWKVETPPANSTVTGAINNQAPQFREIDVSKRKFDFRLTETSPAVNKGTNAGVSIDLDNHSRPLQAPDLGCYESF
ncbi:choice-of-anchor Q domain-containing protein [Paraflavisolibacter sp. H34]|uniref:choice-of-anchor Q domain-containing protein n=1 Tax=Huijunlia imazamoxiresistens TaxID=3127457 RepID=UPI003018B3BA